MSLHCKESTKAAFKGKHVLLTGASGGLGRSLALQLAGCGAATLILSARKEDELQKVAEECRQVDAGRSSLSSDALQVFVITCDLADAKSVAKMAQQVSQMSPQVNILINNGGVSSRSRFLDTQIAVDERIMQINFLSGAALAKALVPNMVQQGFGRIIWISSVQGLVGIPNRSSYAASKFAVQGYCESLRAELASDGVTVHVASPGYIRTNLSKSALTGDGAQHGKMDATTEAGADPDRVAVDILDSVASGQADFCVAATFSAVAAIWMRLLCPSLLRSLLVKRYQKSLKEKSD